MRHIILVILVSVSLSTLQARTWTDTNGRSMEAEVVKVEDGTVFFKKSDGMRYMFALSALSEADQTYIKENYKLEKGSSTTFDLSSRANSSNPSASSQPPSEVAAWLEKNLVKRNGKRVSRARDLGVAQADYIALYFSASWCPPCRKFTPKLVDFYNEQKKTHDNFEIVFVSSDRDEDSMESYMIDYEMPWPAVSHNRAKDNKVRDYSGNGIPCLVLIDRNGEVIMHSYEDGKYMGPTRVMNKLDEVLAEPKSS